MKSRNGVSSQFLFTITNKNTGVRTKLYFSFKHQALEERTKEKWIVDTYDDGTEEQLLLHLWYYFKIDWTELMEGEDADKLQIVRNAEFRGDKLELTPHIDVPKRHFVVTSLKDDKGEQDIMFAQIMNDRKSPGNRGAIIVYKSRTYQSWEIVDPSNQKCTVHKIFQRIG